MKTVQDYKQLGLVFIQGDYINTHEGKKQEPLNCYGVGYCNDSRSNDEKFVIEFAWRNNDGVKPEYRGVIEVALRNGSTCCKYDSDAYLWPKAFSSVFKWRPVVLQSESPKEDKLMEPSEVGQSCREPKAIFNTESTMFGDRLRKVMGDFENGDLDMSVITGKPMKPVYTAEMHARNELPPVNSKVKVCIEEAGFYVDEQDVKFEGKAVTVKAAFSNTESEKIVAVENEDGNCYCYIIECIKPIIKTIKVNGFDVPAPMSEAPELGSEYFIPSINNDDFVEHHEFHGDSYDKRWLSRGLIHSTKSAAIAHAKAMLGINPNA